MTGSEPDQPTVAVFRPDDDRLQSAVTLLESLDVEPVPDPMLEIEATGAAPRNDGTYTILTSKTGVELAAEADWDPGETTLVAIGPSTAAAARAAGYDVDLIPEEYTSSGLVRALADEVDGERVEVARSDHGSERLLDGLQESGAYVHETILYELSVPNHAGDAVEMAAAGDLDAALFSSSLTVEHFLEVAAELGLEDATRKGLEAAVVGAIGQPTADTAAAAGIEVDVVPESADFEALARAVLADLDIA